MSKESPVMATGSLCSSKQLNHLLPFIGILLILSSCAASPGMRVWPVSSYREGILLLPFSSSNGTIMSVVSSNPDLKFLHKALNRAGVSALLSNTSAKFTLFAPTNGAFDRAFTNRLLQCIHNYYYTSPCKSLDDLLLATNLQQLLLNHVVQETFKLESVTHQIFQFIGGAMFEVSRSFDKTKVGDSTVISRTRVSNGDLLVIDGMLSTIEPLTGLPADLSLNASSIQEASKVLDTPLFNMTKMEEMAEGVQLLNIPAFQMNRNLVAFPDGGLEHEPVLVFDPSLNTKVFEGEDKKFKYPELQDVIRPSNDVDMAYMTIFELGALIRSKQVTSLELVNIFTERLKRYDGVLKVVVSYTTTLAREQALAADKLLERGIYLGPLHGIPYGLKDTMSVPGYRTTWGSTSFKHQVINEEAWVYQRLMASGAVLIAKLVCGSLAYDDIWFGGRTRNPWNIAEFSTGSSAGPAASTSAGLVPFAIGSETSGSITYPAARTGVTAIRPTFGMVGRSSVFTLSKSLDKLGPFCRSAADCAVILDIIRGKDPNDISSKDIHLRDPFQMDVSKLTVGYLADADMDVVRVLKSKGVNVFPMELEYSVTTAAAILNFTMDVDTLSNLDHWQRAGLDDEYEAQDQWPVELRRARLIPAVEYIQALALAMAYQEVTNHHLQRPPIDDLGLEHLPL